MPSPRPPLYSASAGRSGGSGRLAEALVMRQEMPMRWIEQREARQVLTAALFEHAPMPPWCDGLREATHDMASHWLGGLGTWLAARHPMGWPAMQLQPAPVRRPVPIAQSSRIDDDGDTCTW
jgi:hypothetical protein